MDVCYCNKKIKQEHTMLTFYAIKQTVQFFYPGFLLEGGGREPPKMLLPKTKEAAIKTWPIVSPRLGRGQSVILGIQECATQQGLLLRVRTLKLGIPICLGL